MKKYISYLLMTAMLLFNLAPISTAASSDFECGQWYDVPDDYMEVIETVCEYGIMQGMSETYFGYNHNLTRAEMAVVGNRIVYGTSTYDGIYEQTGFSTAMFNYLLVPYNDAPADLEQNTWILKAMFYSSNIDSTYYEYPNGIMTGDGNGEYTSFRPLENVNIAEAYKVLYEAAYKADILDDRSQFTYSGSPWYGDLLTFLDDNHGISSLDLDAQTLYLGGAVDKSYGPFYDDVYREHVAQFLYFMIEGGVIDEDLLQQHVSDSEVENEPVFTITDLYDEDGRLYFEVTNSGTVSVDGAVAHVVVREFNSDDERTDTDEYELDFEDIGVGEIMTGNVNLYSSTEYVEIYIWTGSGSSHDSEATEDVYSIGTTINSSSSVDLELSDIYHASTWGEFYVEVTNTGSEEIDYTGDMHLQLFVNDDDPMKAIMFADLAEEDDDFLSPGGVSVFGPYEWEYMESFVDGGVIDNVAATIDEHDYLDETDESNNSMTLNL